MLCDGECNQGEATRPGLTLKVQTYNPRFNTRRENNNTEPGTKTQSRAEFDLRKSTIEE